MFRAGSLFVSWLCACFGAAEGFAQILRPADIVMNEAAGRGGLLIVTVRSGSGEEWPVVLDTGCAKTGLQVPGAETGAERRVAKVLEFWGFTRGTALRGAPDVSGRRVATDEQPERGHL